MTEHGFDKAYWEQHWRDRQPAGAAGVDSSPPNPYLASETGNLPPGTALDAGCGAGAEAIWLAAHGWQVTAADISAEVLARAAERAATSEVAGQIDWVEADLSGWEPGRQFDLVTTHYAHPAIPQLEFYDRIAGWVAPGGTLLIIGHLHTHGADSHGDAPPAEASVTAAGVVDRLDGVEWKIITADERHRSVTAPDGRTVVLHDVVVRATRRARSAG